MLAESRERMPFFFLKNIMMAQPLFGLLVPRNRLNLSRAAAILLSYLSCLSQLAKPYLKDSSRRRIGLCQPKDFQNGQTDPDDRWKSAGRWI